VGSIFHCFPPGQAGHLLIGFGSIDDILNLSMPLILTSSLSKLVNESPVDFPKSPILTPVITISFTPFPAMCSAFADYEEISGFLLRPRQEE